MSNPVTMARAISAIVSEKKILFLIALQSGTECQEKC